ncbi:MAG TPA: hypothetical protein ENO30_05590 [Thermodesulfobium narugense]|nr:hypothetical protein [Thermodesulfobium narugense]
MENVGLELKLQLIADLRTYKKLNRLSYIYGIPVPELRKILNKLNINEYTLYSKEEMIEYLKRGYSYKDIAREWNVSYPYVIKLVKAYKVSKKEIIANTIKEYLEQGFSIEQISKELNLEKKIIYNYMKKYNISRKTVYISKIKYYLEQNYTVKEIAQKMNKHETTIRRTVNKYLTNTVAAEEVT